MSLQFHKLTPSPTAVINFDILVGFCVVYEFSVISYYVL